MKFIRILLLVIFISVGSFASDVNIDKLSAQAQKEDKQILIFFHMNYCQYCERMIDENFAKETFLQELNKDFILVDININEEGNIKYKDFDGDKGDFAEHYKVHFYPTIKFINKNKIVYTIKGYRDIEKFDFVLKYIKTKSYTNMDLSDFIDNIKMDED